MNISNVHIRATFICYSHIWMTYENFSSAHLTHICTFAYPHIFFTSAHPKSAHLLVFTRIPITLVSAFADNRHAGSLKQVVQFKQASVWKVWKQYNSNVILYIPQVNMPEPMPPAGMIDHLFAWCFKNPPAIAITKMAMQHWVTRNISRVHSGLF